MMRGQANRSPGFVLISKHFAAYIGNNGLVSDHGPGPALHRIATLTAAWAIAAAAAACADEGESAVPGADQAPTTLLPAAPAASHECVASAALQATLYGALEAVLDWEAGTMQCEGMPRPDGRGVRLRFAGSVGGQDLAVIIAIPELGDEPAAELASNVTIIEEGNGRFFSTPGLDSCWSDIATIEPGPDDISVVAGTLYCISPLVEVNGDASVSLPELEFSGIIDPDSS